MVSIAVVYHSGYDHTARQAQAVADGAAALAGVTSRMIPVDKIEQHWADLEAADAIIFGAPTYMGGVSAPFKAFMDASGKMWAGQKWKDKIAAGFTNSASHSGDKLNTLIQLSVFAAQHGMLWVNLGLPPGNNSSQGRPDDLNRLGSYLGAMAQSNADAGADVAPGASDLRTAMHLGRRVAEVALQFAQGRGRKAA